MGRIQAIFKADGGESDSRCSIAEWWFEPKSTGPGAHAHEDDDVFYVLAGTMSFRLGESRLHAQAGSLVLVPAGTTQDFRNRGSVSAGVLNFSAPRGAE